MQELDSAICLILEASEELRAKDPKHELLQFCELGHLSEEFKARFGQGHISKVLTGTEFEVAGMYANYHRALEAATDSK